MPCRPMNVASVTTIAGMLSQVTSQPWTSPNPPAIARISVAPHRASPGPAPSGIRNDASTTTNPARAPTERSIRPTRMVPNWAIERNARIERKVSMVSILKADRKYSLIESVPRTTIAVSTLSTAAGNRSAAMTRRQALLLPSLCAPDRRRAPPWRSCSPR